jgi:hypothetical protein
MAMPVTIAVANDNSTTMRMMGKPSPGFCVFGCGKAA